MHCPFCGEQEKIQVVGQNKHHFGPGPGVYRYVASVQCGACNAAGPVVESMSANGDALTKETAAQLWNDRLMHEEELSLRVAFRLE